MIRLAPIDHVEVNQFVQQHHRHNAMLRFQQFYLSIRDTKDKLRGVALMRTPIASPTGAAFVDALEVTRCCTDGVKNGCSMLYGACSRIAQALGYKRIITYTLTTESGASLKASGFEIEHTTVPKPHITWNTRPDRHPQLVTGMVDVIPLGIKYRWSKHYKPPKNISVERKQKFLDSLPADKFDTLPAKILVLLKYENNGVTESLMYLYPPTQDLYDDPSILGIADIHNAYHPELCKRLCVVAKALGYEKLITLVPVDHTAKKTLKNQLWEYKETIDMAKQAQLFTPGVPDLMEVWLKQL